MGPMRLFQSGFATIWKDARVFDLATKDGAPLLSPAELDRVFAAANFNTGGVTTPYLERHEMIPACIRLAVLLYWDSEICDSVEGAISKPSRVENEGLVHAADLDLAFAVSKLTMTSELDERRLNTFQFFSFLERRLAREREVVREARAGSSSSSGFSRTAGSQSSRSLPRSHAGSVESLSTFGRPAASAAHCNDAHHLCARARGLRGGPARPAPRASLRSSTAYDVVVVGGGMSGLSTALELRRRGRSVCVLSRDLAQAATLAAGGMLAPQAERLPGGPLLDLCVRSREARPARARDADDPGRSTPSAAS
ncbi:glycine oxidase ThiO [Aureococcus anophagefferens]|uniref:Glycine oxidase ThiO n=1 Tax=Aureococcus anophagefferens TaxID=44056 RepID=A0ABR1GFI6_AURAN